MFSKVFIAVAAASLALAGSQCNVGYVVVERVYNDLFTDCDVLYSSVQCCNQLQDANSAAVAGILSAIGVSAQNVVGQIGLNCNPVSVIGIGSGAKWLVHFLHSSFMTFLIRVVPSLSSSQPVCCENNNYNGLVNVGCSPVNL
jgi:hypothetical protein